MPAELVARLVSDRAAGRLLKRSPRFETRVSGAFAVKSSAGTGVLDYTGRTLFPYRGRRAWEAALYLTDCGVSVPAPIAYAEQRSLGVLVRTVYISQYIEGTGTVEEHAQALVRHGNDPERVRAFLSRVSATVASLTACDAYHADLSGKNLLTRDGSAIWVVDLDAVQLGVRYGSSRRMRNHVQLYDSFCDLWGPEVLEDLIRPLAPTGVDAARWIAEVRRRQALRRARHLARTRADRWR